MIGKEIKDGELREMLSIWQEGQVRKVKQEFVSLIVEHKDRVMTLREKQTAQKKAKAGWANIAPSVLAKAGALMGVPHPSSRGEINMTGPMVPRNETILNTEGQASRSD